MSLDLRPPRSPMITIEKLWEGLERAVASIGEFRGQRETLLDRLMQVEVDMTMLQAVGERRAVLGRENRELSKELYEAQEAVARLDEQVSSLRKQLGERDHMIGRLRSGEFPTEIARDLAEELEGAKSLVEGLEAGKASLREELAARQSTIDGLEAEILHAWEQSDDSAQREEKVRQQAAEQAGEAAREAQEAELYRTELELELAEREQDLSIARQRLADEAAVMEKLKEELDTARSQLEAATALVPSAESRAKQAESQVRELQRRLSRLQARRQRAGRPTSGSAELGGAEPTTDSWDAERTALLAELEALRNWKERVQRALPVIQPLVTAMSDLAALASDAVVDTAPAVSSGPAASLSDSPGVAMLGDGCAQTPNATVDVLLDENMRRTETPQAAGPERPQPQTHPLEPPSQASLDEELVAHLLVPPNHQLAHEFPRELRRHLRQPVSSLVIADALRRLPERQRSSRPRQRSFLIAALMDRLRRMGEWAHQPIVQPLPVQWELGEDVLPNWDWEWKAQSFTILTDEAGHWGVLHLRLTNRSERNLMGQPLYIVLADETRAYAWSPVAGADVPRASCPDGCTGSLASIALEAHGERLGHLSFPIPPGVTPQHWGLLHGGHAELMPCPSTGDDC